MHASINGLLTRLFREKGDARSSRLSVLAVSPCYIEQLAIRIASYNGGWNLVLCPTFEIAMRARKRTTFSVIIYDLDVVDVGWREGIHKLLNAGDPVCVVAVSGQVDDSLWERALGCGVYDVQSKPLNSNGHFRKAVEQAHAFLTSQPLADLWNYPASVL
jgi:hypothetical protein